MALLDLVRRLGRETGLNPDNREHKAQLIELINDGAEEIYTQTDLPRCLMEIKVSVDTTTPLPRVTLPAFVGEIRGIRDHYQPIELHDVRPKYHTLPWPSDRLYTFRIHRETPLCRSIDNAVALYMEPVTGVTTGFRVTVTGRTSTAQEISAEFDMNGSGTAEVTLFEDIYSITKNEYTPNDVIFRVADADGLEISRIFNYNTSARYIEVETTERPEQCDCNYVGMAGRCLDVLYKPQFRKLINDSSVFQLDGYDMVIVMTAVKVFRLRGLNSEATESKVLAARTAHLRAEELLRQAMNNKIQPQKMVINFGRARGDHENLRGLRASRYNR